MNMFCLLSCDKYESKITGMVYYTDENDNIQPAAYAVVAKTVQKGDSLHTVAAVLAGENGEFVFDHTTKGTWILSGKLNLEKDSITTVSYFGLSESFTTSGENQVDITIVLKPVIKEETE
jgi:hypothetical protein